MRMRNAAIQRRSTRGPHFKRRLYFVSLSYGHHPGMKEYGGMPSDGVELHDSLEHLLLVPELQYLATPAQVSHNHIRRIKT